MTIHQYPRCAGYIKAMGIHDLRGMEDKHCAWLLGEEAFDVPTLDSIGAKGLPLDKWGELLPRMESAFGTRKAQEQTAHASASLKALIGARGVKTNNIKTADDWWTVAEIMWPRYVTRTKSLSLDDLLYQLKRLSKAQRKSARENMAKVPSRFRSQTQGA